MSNVIPADDLKASALATANDDRKLMEFRGKQYEVRAPTLAQSAYCERMAKNKSGEVDMTKRAVLTVMQCVYYPNTDKRVFDLADEDALMNQGPKGAVGAFGKAIAELVTDGEEVAKN